MLYDVTNSRLIVVENIHGDFNEIIGCSTIVFHVLTNFSGCLAKD